MLTQFLVCHLNLRFYTSFVFFALSNGSHQRDDARAIIDQGFNAGSRMIMSVAWLLKGTVERGRERETAVAKSLLQNSSSLIFLEANILHPKALLKSFEDAFPFPKVVYVSSLKYAVFFAYIHTIHNIFFPTGFFYILSGSLDFWSFNTITLPQCGFDRLFGKRVYIYLGFGNVWRNVIEFPMRFWLFGRYAWPFHHPCSIENEHYKKQSSTASDIISHRIHVWLAI